MAQTDFMAAIRLASRAIAAVCSVHAEEEFGAFLRWLSDFHPATSICSPAP